MKKAFFAKNNSSGVINNSCLSCTPEWIVPVKCVHCAVQNRRKVQKNWQRSSLLFGGQNWFNSLSRYLFCTRMIWRKEWIHLSHHIVLVQFILFFISSWCNSSYSSNRPDAIDPILQIVRMQLILFFKWSWFNPSYSSNRPGAIHPIHPCAK